MLRLIKVFAVFVLFMALTTRAEIIATKYPVVLVHGLLGFDTMLGAVDYWNGIPDELRAVGVEVYVTRVSKLDSTQVRGEQLFAQIKSILALSGAEKVNLIGHSHGGLDARYVAGEYPQLVASVTSIATPHQGALLADALVGEAGIISTSSTAMLNAFGSIMAYLSGDDHTQDAEASLKSFTGATLAAFNQRYPYGLPTEYCGEGKAVDNGIRYYSWAGIEVLTSTFDFTDYMFYLTSFADDRPSDGLVERCSSHLGKVIRDDYRHNHLDLVNGMWGQVGQYDTNPVDIFIEHAKRLEADGV